MKKIRRFQTFKLFFHELKIDRLFGSRFKLFTKRGLPFKPPLEQTQAKFGYSARSSCLLEEKSVSAGQLPKQNPWLCSSLSFLDSTWVINTGNLLQFLSCYKCRNYYFVLFVIDFRIHSMKLRMQDVLLAFLAKREWWKFQFICTCLVLFIGIFFVYWFVKATMGGVLILLTISNVFVSLLLCSNRMSIAVN